MDGLMKLLLLFRIRNGLLSDVFGKDILVCNGQELSDNKELIQQFWWFEVDWRRDLTAESIPDLVLCSETTWLFLDYMVGLYQGNYQTQLSLLLHGQLKLPVIFCFSSSKVFSSNLSCLLAHSSACFFLRLFKDR